jgi:hypothetical protein
MDYHWSNSPHSIVADVGVAVIAGLLLSEAVTSEEQVVFVLVMMCIWLR